MAKSAQRKVPREADRKKIPAPLQHQLLMEAGYKCGNPSCHNVITLELHHIEYVSEGGGNEESNLLVLCPYHHAMHHAGQIPVEAIRHWKGLLTALNQAFDRKGRELLLFLYGTRREQIRYSGDGLLQFSGLIGDGLARVAHTQQMLTADSGLGAKMFTKTTHAVELTERGLQLVEAWMAGDDARYRSLISNPPADEGGMDKEQGA